MTETSSHEVQSSALQRRIDRMFVQDCWFAWVGLALLWVTIGYVYLSTFKLIADSSVRIAISIGAFLVLLFNSASIGAMIRHYKQDKDHIYGLDIRHQDENRARKIGAAIETVMRT